MLVQRVQKPLPSIYLYIYLYIYLIYKNIHIIYGCTTKGIATKGIGYKRYRFQKVLAANVLITKDTVLGP